MAKKPALTVVRPGADLALSPPPSLGEVGRAVWSAVQREYKIEDSGGKAILEAAAAALDRSADCAAQIARDGLMINTRHGPKEHPLLKSELSNRAFAVRALGRLGLDVEPLRAHVGRPGGGVGITWKDV